VNLLGETMKDITEEEAALLMLELKMQVLEIGLKSLSKIIDECQASVDNLELAIKAYNGAA
jgi:hypothetical protein